MRILCLVFLLCGKALAAPCGLSGSMEERMKECSSSKGKFVLITRTQNGTEVYKDLKSGLFWGPRINFEFNQYGSQKACDTPDAKILQDLKWRLPTVKEFEQAAANGMKDALPQMNHWFWTSTPVSKARRTKRRKKKVSTVFLWDGTGQVSEAGNPVDAASVRCVAD